MGYRTKNATTLVSALRALIAAAAAEEETPAGFTFVTVTADFDLANGLDPVGAVSFIPSEPMVNDETVVSASVTRALNIDGVLLIDLAANTDPGTTTPSGDAAYYLVEESINGAIRRYRVTVPHDAGPIVNLADLTHTAIDVAALPQPTSVSAFPKVTYPVSGPPGPPGPPGPTGPEGPAGSSVSGTLPWINVQDYGAVGNGSTDDTAAIQSAITAAAAMVSGLTTKSAAIVAFGPKHYRAAGLTLPGKVALVGNGTRLTANASGPLITISNQFNRVEGIFLQGGGNGLGANGIVIDSTGHWNTLKQLVFDQFDGRAVYDQGIATWSSELFAQNCLLGAASLSVYTGVYEVFGTDSWITNCEFTASRYPANGMSASGKACAFAIYGANTMATNVICETSDHGVYLGSGATQLHLSGVRGELNYGHGWLIEGGGGRISNPMALRNSQASNLGYDGFHVTNGANIRYTVINAWSESAAAPARQNNGINDSNVSNSVYNQWISPVDVGSNVPFFAANSTQTVFGFADHPPAALPTGVLPAVSGKKFWNAANGSATTVTNFTQGVNGQQLLIKGEGQTTLQHNATISNAAGADLLLASGTWYRYLRINGVWTQIS